MPLMDHQFLERAAEDAGDGANQHGAAAARGGRTVRDLGDERGELFRRARFLRDEDRLIIELAFKNHMSMRQIARATGRPAGSISRRLVRLCTHLRDPAVLVMIDPAFPFPLPPEHRQLAVEHIVQWRSARQLAELHQMPLHEVRRILSYVKGWCKGVVCRRAR
jgi:DNA-directed RNA polymerase specialized sigma24 family protein